MATRSGSSSSRPLSKAPLIRIKQDQHRYYSQWLPWAIIICLHSAVGRQVGLSSIMSGRSLMEPREDSWDLARTHILPVAVDDVGGACRHKEQ